MSYPIPQFLFSNPIRTGTEHFNSAASGSSSGSGNVSAQRNILRYVCSSTARGSWPPRQVNIRYLWLGLSGWAGCNASTELLNFAPVRMLTLLCRTVMAGVADSASGLEHF